MAHGVNYVHTPRGAVQGLNYVWDVGTLAWVPETQPGGGGGGGAVTVAAGADVTEGNTTDVAVQGDNAGTVSAKLRGLNKSIAAGIPVTNASLDGTSLASIKADLDKIPSQGQALAAASTPVVLTAIQVSTLTPPAAITGFALEAGHLAAIDTSTAKIPPQGQALSAASMPVVLPATQITTLTPPSNTGYALDATLATIDADIKANIVLKAGTNIVGKVGIDQTTPGTTNLVQVGGSLPAGTAVIGHVIVDTAPTTAVTNAGLSNIDVLLSSRTKPADQQHTIVDSITAGSTVIGKVGIDQTTPGTTNLVQVGGSLPAGTAVIGHVIADTGSTTAVTGTVTTKETKSASTALSSVSVTNVNTSVLASNANRLGATIFNEGAAIAYVKLGATASVTSYTVQLVVGAYYEVPFGYTGAIDAITSSGTATTRVDELT